jgi:hypothetical protein
LPEISTVSVLARLKAAGLLLLQDALLPSLVSLVAGGPVRGSWWGHASGGRMYHLYNELAEHPDVLVVKLVSGKVTFVHRSLWPPIVAVGSARDAWQLLDLPVSARQLLARLDDAGGYLPHDAQSTPSAVKALESRLLVHTQEVHTSTGAHAKDVQTWVNWAHGVGLAEPWPPLASARASLEAVVDRLNAEYGARGRLPWR